MTGLGVEARKTSVNTDYLLNSGLNFESLGSSEIISLMKAFLYLKVCNQRFLQPCLAPICGKILRLEAVPT